ncbi:MAG: GNAT family N-acetyltransferase [Bacteroidaceae bacterium]|nr:GNAT family N-acetyltransferase [Bacteroidaceae bacterium]
MTSPLRLRALEPEDLELVYAMENTPDVSAQSAVRTPVSRYDVRRYLETPAADPLTSGELRLVAVRTGDGAPVALADLTVIDALNAHAEVGVAVLPEERGRGYALETLRLLEDTACRRLGLHTLTALVAATNAAALGLFRRAGYAHAGTLPHYRFSGDGWDDVEIFYKRLAL